MLNSSLPSGQQSFAEQGIADAVNLTIRSVQMMSWRKGFIEFEFTVGDPLLTVELVMPPREFFAFCEQEDAQIFAPAELAESLAAHAEAPAHITITPIKDNQERSAHVA